MRSLEDAIRASWSSETSDSPDEWRADNPARGQCGTTAFVVRALLGGDIVIAQVGGTDPQEHHAWNRFGSGSELDLTREQFDGPPDLAETAIPEDMVEELCGEQARLLLARVRSALAETE